MTIRDLCLAASCLEVSLCAAENGRGSFDAERIDHFHDVSGNQACHP